MTWLDFVCFDDNILYSKKERQSEEEELSY